MGDLVVGCSDLQDLARELIRRGVPLHVFNRILRTVATGEDLPRRRPTEARRADLDR